MCQTQEYEDEKGPVPAPRSRQSHLGRQTTNSHSTGDNGCSADSREAYRSTGENRGRTTHSGGAGGRTKEASERVPKRKVSEGQVPGEDVPETGNCLCKGLEAETLVLH